VFNIEITDQIVIFVKSVVKEVQLCICISLRRGLKTLGMQKELTAAIIYPKPSVSNKCVPQKREHAPKVYGIWDIYGNVEKNHNP
jgi:hypothetical protein